MEEIRTILHYEYWAQSAFLTLVSIDHISLIQSPFLMFLLAIAWSIRGTNVCIHWLGEFISHAMWPFMPTNLYKSDPLEGELCIFSEWEIDPWNDSRPPYSTLLSAFAPPESQDITSQLHHQMHHNSSLAEPPTVAIWGPYLFEPCQASYSDPPIETTLIPPETNPT